MSDKELAAKLRACGEDPMWAEHAEVPKAWCIAAADRLDALASAGDGLETSEEQITALCDVIKEHQYDSSHMGLIMSWLKGLLRDRDRQSATIATLRQQIEAKDKALSERAAAGLSEAAIEGDQIVIRVPIATIPIAFEHWPDAPRDEEGDPLYRVTDAATFAKGIVSYLNAESEDGTTRVHLMLDSAMSEALEQGEEGVEEVRAVLTPGDLKP